MPHTIENWNALQKRPDVFPLEGVPAPAVTGYRIEGQQGLLHIHTPWSPINTELMQRMPEYHKWDKERRAWIAKPTRHNLDYLRAQFPQATWDKQAEQWYQDHLTKKAERVAEIAQLREHKAQVKASVPEIDDYKFGGPNPWSHQRKAFYLSRDRTAYAYFMEQRTGKSKVLIDVASWNFIKGKIRQVLIVAPNSVKTNWVTDELPEHMPDYIPWIASSWSPTLRKAERAQLTEVLDTENEKFRWLVMNYEALSTKKGAESAMKFVKLAPTLVALDESQRIKTPSAARTRAAIAIGKHAVLRRILTGTPATQGPLDTYTQGLFLDSEILGYTSFYPFRNHFAIMGGWNHKEVIGYSHLDELQALWDAHSYRVTRDECFDIPPKGYQKLVVDMTPEQQRIYDGMADRMRAELSDGRTVTATIVLTQMLRLAQIAGGFVPAMLDGIVLFTPTDDKRADPIPGTNPKIEALIELAGDVQGKMVVWARFRSEVAAATAALRKEYGDDAVVEFHGGIDDEGRIEARTAFQDPTSPVRFLVGQTETGGLGINLDQARTIVYISNSFSLESRLQSEDRPMSGRQRHSVAVIDIIAKGTVDELVVSALRNKQDVARLVTGDAWKQWI